MFKMKLLLSATLLLITSFAFAQNEDSVMIKKITDEVLLNGKAYSNLYTLCKTVGQRLSGSAGMYKGEAWGAKVLKDAGAQNVYLQQCQVPHWVRGKKEEAGFRTHKRSMDPSFNILSIGNAVGTGDKGVLAKIIEVKNFAELDQRKDEVKGKIVFYNYPFNKTLLRGAYGDAVRYRSGGASTAAKYGALAVIVRSMSHSTDNNPHTGSTRYDSLYAKIPAVAIGLKDADRLSEYLSNTKVTVTLKTNGHFLPDTIGHNVIGELRGTEFPDDGTGTPERRRTHRGDSRAKRQLPRLRVCRR